MWRYLGLAPGRPLHPPPKRRNRHDAPSNLGPRPPRSKASPATSQSSCKPLVLPSPAAPTSLTRQAAPTQRPRSRSGFPIVHRGLRAKLLWTLLFHHGEALLHLSTTGRMIESIRSVMARGPLCASTPKLCMAPCTRSCLGQRCFTFPIYALSITPLHALAPTQRIASSSSSVHTTHSILQCLGSDRGVGSRGQPPKHDEGEEIGRDSVQLA